MNKLSSVLRPKSGKITVEKFDDPSVTINNMSGDEDYGMDIDESMGDMENTDSDII